MTSPGMTSPVSTIQLILLSGLSLSISKMPQFLLAKIPGGSTPADLISYLLVGLRDLLTRIQWMNSVIYLASLATT
jgi:hypothetical protein